MTVQTFEDIREVGQRERAGCRRTSSRPGLHPVAERLACVLQIFLREIELS